MKNICLDTGSKADAPRCAACICRENRLLLKCFAILISSASTISLYTFSIGSDSRRISSDVSFAISSHPLLRLRRPALPALHLDLNCLLANLRPGRQTYLQGVSVIFSEFCEKHFFFFIWYLKNNDINREALWLFLRCMSKKTINRRTNINICRCYNDV